MSDPSHAVQVTVRGRLIGNPAVTALVPAANIFDKNSRPEVFPCIILGESQVVDAAANIMRSIVTVYLTLHLWQREEGLSGVKAIANAVRRAMRPRLFLNSADYHMAGCFISDSRFIRDPSGEHGHDIVTIQATVQESWVFTR